MNIHIEYFYSIQYYNINILNINILIILYILLILIHVLVKMSHGLTTERWLGQGERIQHVRTALMRLIASYALGVTLVLLSSNTNRPLHTTRNQPPLSVKILVWRSQ